MKKNKFRIIGIYCIAAAMSFTSCTKETDFLTPDDVPSALKGAKADAYLPGTDITDQLRNDLSDGLSVTLPAGHFYLSESIFILGYTGGIIKGAGMDATVIETSPGFKVPQNPFFPPEMGTTASILEFQNTQGDIIIKALSILVKGDHPAEGHKNPFGGYHSTNIDNVIAVIGGGISLECKDMRIQGEYVGDVEGAYNGYNITWSVLGTGFLAPEPFNHLSLKNCEIIGSGAAAIDLWLGTTAEIKDNVISNADVGIMLLENPGMQTVKDCQFSNISSTAFVTSNIGPHCFKDNTLDGQLMANECQ